MDSMVVGLTAKITPREIEERKKKNAAAIWGYLFHGYCGEDFRLNLIRLSLELLEPL